MNGIRPQGYVTEAGLAEAELLLMQSRGGSAYAPQTPAGQSVEGQTSLSAEPAPAGYQHLMRHFREMEQRLAQVERGWSQVRQRDTIPTSQPSQSRINIHDDSRVERGDLEGGNTMANSVEPQNHTLLSKTLDVLDGTLKTKPSSANFVSHRLGSETASTSIETDRLLPLEVSNVLNLDQNVRLRNIATLRDAFDIYFSYSNPNLPILNENHFRAQFENYLVTGGNDIEARSKDLFIILVNLVYAETLLLSEQYEPSSPIPGWPEYSFAESLLNRTSWLSRGNIQIIQCLLLKARFLATVQRMRSAYDTMCKAVQICFHIGLHDEQGWGRVSPYQRTMRQRVFWSMFYLDRGIAWSAGLPYLIRESEVIVDFPKSIDDKLLFANRALPEESPTMSCIPYLNSLVRWAKLSSKIWDKMFSASAPKPASEELVSSLDAELLYSTCQLPSSLWWNPSALKENRIDDDTLPYVKRQMCLSHLVRTSE